MNIDKLKKVMAESLPEKILKDIDSRTSTKAPWQNDPNKVGRRKGLPHIMSMRHLKRMLT